MVDLSPYKARLSHELQKFHTVYDDPKDAFASELTGAGFTPPPRFEMGKLVRIADPQDKGIKKTGWCVYDEHQYDDYILGVGVYGTWRGNPERVNWSSKSMGSMTPSERDYYAAQIERGKKEREAEQARVWEAAAIAAMEQWEAAGKDCTANEYLKRKGVGAYGAIRQNGDVLILPVTRHDKISSVQRIFPDGTKRFKTGGRIKGGYFKIEGIGDYVYICEGYATGASLHEATGAAVYVAFDCGNLYDVAGTAKEAEPGRVCIIAGDDDFKGQSGNAGRDKATQAGASHGMAVIFPGDGYIDFNDYHQAEGIEALRKYLAKKPKAATRELIEKAGVAYPPGILGEIVNYYNATSGSDQPLFAVQTAIATLSVILGRDFVTNKQNRTSLFLMCLGETGTGKETIKQVPRKIMEALGVESLIVGSGYTSGSAVLCSLMNQPKQISIIDEYAKYMQVAMHKNASAGMAEANSQIMQAFNEINGTATGKNYSLLGLTKEKRKELMDLKIYNPALTLLAIATPDDLFDTLDVGQINDGFLNRFLIVTSDARRAVRVHKDPVDVPSRIIEWHDAIKDRMGLRIVDYLVRPKDITLSFAADAWELQEAFNLECVEWGDRLKKAKLDKMTMRTNEQAMRLALICALSRDPWAEVVKREDMAWAIDWTRYCLKNLIDRLKMSIYSGQFEKDKLLFLKEIRETGESGVSEREMIIRKPMSNYNKKDREAILQELATAGLIAVTDRKTGGRGRPTSVYIAVDGDA